MGTNDGHALVLIDTVMLPFGMALQVLELLRDDGLSPYAQWFDGLAPDVAAKVATAKYRMQQGNLSGVEWFRGIGEYKINYGTSGQKQIYSKKLNQLWRQANARGNEYGTDQRL